ASVLVASGPGLLVQQLRAHWRAVLVLGIFNFAVSQILAMSAQGLLPASVNGLLNNTHPLWVAIVSALFYPPWRPGLLVGGSVVALLGVGLVLLPDLASGPAAGAALSPLGIVLSLGRRGIGLPVHDPADERGDRRPVSARADQRGARRRHRLHLDRPGRDADRRDHAPQLIGWRPLHVRLSNLAAEHPHDYRRGNEV